MPTCSLVTGASRGIGKAVAHALASAGHSVAVHTGHDLSAAHDVRARLPGDGHIVVVGDLASPEGCAQVITKVTEQLGDLDVLVNNAGIFTSHPIDTTTYAGWQQAGARPST